MTPELGCLCVALTPSARFSLLKKPTTIVATFLPAKQFKADSCVKKIRGNEGIMKTVILILSEPHKQLFLFRINRILLTSLWKIILFFN